LGAAPAMSVAAAGPSPIGSDEMVKA
jgi:hypothetical protein